MSVISPKLVKDAAPVNHERAPCAGTGSRLEVNELPCRSVAIVTRDGSIDVIDHAVVIWS